jgi:hypothetical protein
MDSANLDVQSAITPRATPLEFLREVMHIYHQHLSLFLKLVLPAAVIAWASYYAANQLVEEISRHFPRDPRLFASHKAEILEMYLIRTGGFFVTWLVYCFSYAGISVAMGKLHEGTIPEGPGQCLQGIREKMGSFLRLCLVLFVIAGIGFAANMLLMPIFYFGSLQSWVCL